MPFVASTRGATVFSVVVVVACPRCYRYMCGHIPMLRVAVVCCCCVALSCHLSLKKCLPPCYYCSLFNFFYYPPLPILFPISVNSISWISKLSSSCTLASQLFGIHRTHIFDLPIQHIMIVTRHLSIMVHRQETTTLAFIQTSFIQHNSIRKIGCNTRLPWE